MPALPTESEVAATHDSHSIPAPVSLPAGPQDDCQPPLQDRKAAAKPTPDFVHLLQQAPRLLQVLVRNTEIASCLSGTCRAMQDLVHSSVRGITVTNTKRTALQQLQLLKSLMAGNWKHLQSLTLRYFKLDWMAANILASGDWPLLHTLDLSLSLLDTEAVTVLTGGSWSIKHLNSSHNFLDVTSLLRLTKAGWPLESLYLREVSRGETGLVKILVRGGWPGLRRLVLASNRLTASEVLPLLKAQWTGLRHLDLSNNILTSDAVRTLIQVNMPRLSRLDLSCNLLSHDALHALSLGNWSQLTHLNLGHCGMYTLEGLSGNWPSLRSLCLSGNSVDDVTVSSLLLQWPLLVNLELEDTMLPFAAVQQLVQGQSPKLRTLRLARNKLGIEAKQLLSDACGRVLHLGLNRVDHDFQEGKGPWPKLKWIFV